MNPSLSSAPRTFGDLSHPFPPLPTESQPLVCVSTSGFIAVSDLAAAILNFWLPIRCVGLIPDAENEGLAVAVFILSCLEVHVDPLMIMLYTPSLCGKVCTILGRRGGRLMYVCRIISNPSYLIDVCSWTDQFDRINSKIDLFRVQERNSWKQ